MKYVEHVKSFVLFLLVILSLILTFSIWSYTPNYQTIKESQVEQITVGNLKELHQVIKPYRMLVSEDNELKGTTSTTLINNIMDTLSNVSAPELNFIQSNLSDEKINSMIRTDNRMTLFFSDEVPFNTFKSILEFEKSELPEVSFKYLLMDWSKYTQSNVLQLLFISEENRTLYSADILLSNEMFLAAFDDVFKNAVDYEEVSRANKLALYVPKDPFGLVEYTYYIAEISPETFKDILFKDPNLVKKNIENITSSKYTDGMSFMTSETKTKIINYVYPASESFNQMKESVLLQDSYDFINEHGGLTGDFRYVYMNAPRHITEYQLFLQGVPVFSNSTSTRITTIWGDNQIFRYKRPYYLLDMDITLEESIRELPTGLEVVESLENINQLDELIVGYYLSQNENELVYTLEPSWFTIQDGNWTRVTTELMGGIEYGLE